MVLDGSLGDHGMNQRFRTLTCFCTLGILAALSTGAAARSHHKQVQNKQVQNKHAQHDKRAHEATGVSHKRHAARSKTKVAAAAPKPASPIDTPPPAATASPLSADLATVKQAFDLVRKGKTSEATSIKNSISDPTAQKLVEWQ